MKFKYRRVRDMNDMCYIVYFNIGFLNVCFFRNIEDNF